MDILSIGLILAGYAAGGIPSGFLVARRIANLDIREYGSGNPGSANVFRVVGKTAGALTLSADLLKGFLPVTAALILRPEQPLVALGVGTAAIAGHLWMVFLNFNGGKGVATTAGVFLAVLPGAMLPTFLIFFAGVALSGHISVGSIVGALLLPLAVWAIGGTTPWTVLAIAASSLILYKHIPNLRRLVAASAFFPSKKADLEKI